VALTGCLGSLSSDLLPMLSSYEPPEENLFEEDSLDDVVTCRRDDQWQPRDYAIQAKERPPFCDNETKPTNAPESMFQDKSEDLDPDTIEDKTIVDRR